MRSLTPLQEQVLGYVNAEGPATVADVAGALLIGTPSARSRLAVLESRGLLSRQHTGHHRGRGVAYVTTGQGAAVAAETFGEEDQDGADVPIPVRLVAYTDGTYTRIAEGAIRRTTRHLTWTALSSDEQATVAHARGAGGTATQGHVTVVPGRRLGVVEEWWR